MLSKMVDLNFVVVVNFGSGMSKCSEALRNLPNTNPNLGSQSWSVAAGVSLDVLDLERDEVGESITVIISQCLREYPWLNAYGRKVAVRSHVCRDTNAIDAY